MEQHDVVTVGAGPVGLALALGLARRGVRVLVLEKNASTTEHSRAPAIWCKTQEFLDELGVMDRLAESGILVPCLDLWDADREQVLVRLPIEELRDETPFARLLITPQATTERILHEALQRTASGEVRFGCEVTDVRETSMGVEVQYRSRGSDQAVRARFVAGCDGAHSTVRERLGASLEGITYRFHAALADVVLREAPELRFPRLTTRPRLAIGIRIGADLWRLILPFSGGRQLPLEQQVADAASSLFPGLAYETVWQSDFTLHRRVSSCWTAGRVVLAGDAAHLNSPVGGEGMNAGILDAAALRDSLGAALASGSSQPLADYASQRRHAIEHGVNRFTDQLTWLLLGGEGRYIRPMFRTANAVLAIPWIRRRVLRRLAMLS